MHTKLTDKIFIEKSKIEKEYKKSWIDFLDGSKQTNLEESFQKVEALLKKDRWVVMEDDLVYDHKIKACWLGLMKKTPNYYNSYDTGEDYKSCLVNLVNIESKYKSRLDLPTKKELSKSLSKILSAPFVLLYKRPSVVGAYVLFKKLSTVQGYGVNENYLLHSSRGVAIPLLRLTKEDNFNLINQEVFFRWIALGLVPKELKNDENYTLLIKEYQAYTFTVENYTTIIDIKLKSNVILPIPKKCLIENLLNEDKERADIKPYHEKMLDDTEQGHWSLWNSEEDFENPITIKLNQKLVARDPKSSIIDGTVGIDFGTKSTVVVYQKDTTKIYPMRIGTGDLAQTIASSHYENPTIMEFNNLEQFIENYNDREGRPFTKWEDLTISHTAFGSLLNSKSEDYNSFISELKQWAGNRNKKLKMVDKNGYVLDLPPFLELGKDETNPIEIYAYYLGLYINNQHNGIYMNYILSFPVTYEVEIRNKIIESFEKGIKKSLPQELHNQLDEIEKLSIVAGASEPAAYAVVALQEYGFEPEDDEKVFYGVFDFGGGTTDFDFGIYREANGKKERRYDYAIEHFGAGGDRYLGGENLLELLSFEVFKKNRDTLLANDIQFILPPECNEFLGSEALLSLSREAKMNTKTLMEKLRPFWEGVEDEMENFRKGSIEVNLTKIDGTQLVNFELDIDNEEMIKILDNRISKGVQNFFNSLRLAFNNHEVNLNEIETINIFLAGNSSKSILVKMIFENEIAKQTEEIKNKTNKEGEIFKVFEPLGNTQESLEKPTGKTGVAFGLIETREGGDILVIDHNIKESNEINFKYYLGESRKKKFKVLVDREEEYGKWVDFVDASRESFELYYSSQSIVTTNKTPIGDSSIKKRILKIDKVNDDALVYLRVVSPTAFEYVVAYKDEIENENYLSNLERIEIEL
jgi:hypothetical protein